MMKITATVAIVAVALLFGGAGGAQAQSPDPDGVVRQAQKKKAQQRAPTRIIGWSRRSGE